MFPKFAAFAGLAWAVWGGLAPMPLAAGVLAAQANPFLSRPAPAGEESAENDAGRDPALSGPGLGASEPAARGPAWDLWLPAEALRWQRDLFHELSEGLAASLRDPGLLFWVSLLAALYGVLHTLLPGHQKTLVVAYFLGEDAPPWHALWAALGFTLFHTLSALALLGLSFWLLPGALGLALDEAGFWAARLSAGGTAVFALWFLFRKLGQRRALEQNLALDEVRSRLGFDFLYRARLGGSNLPAGRFFGLLALAGLLPCPATILVLMFSFTRGEVGLGLGTALAVSAGMGLTLGVLALVTLGGKATAARLSARAPSAWSRRFGWGFETAAAGALLILSLAFFPF